MKENHQKCKLCEKEKKLQNSHIIPRFVFQMMRGESGESSLYVSEGETQKAHGGETEPMLCSDCEALFGKWETAASWLVKRANWKTIVHGDDLFPPRPLLSQVQINRYKEIKLFILSYLWRCHYSNLETYKYFKLSQETIKDLDSLMRYQLGSFQKTKYKNTPKGRIFERPILSKMMQPKTYAIQLIASDFAHNGYMLNEVTIPPSLSTRKDNNKHSHVDFTLVGLMFRVFLRGGYSWLSLNTNVDQKIIDAAILRPGKVLVTHQNERDSPEMASAYFKRIKEVVGGV